MDAVLDYDEALATYDPVMGFEVHVELNTNTKMFCGCATEFGAEPNTQTCPVCLGLPGALPVVNAKGVESAIRIGLALNCEIAEWCRFARKNYFYPDMPKNFQTSQYDEPIAFDGYLDVELEDGTPWRVEIERAGQQVAVTFVGAHPNNDFRHGRTYLEIQRRERTGRFPLRIGRREPRAPHAGADRRSAASAPAPATGRRRRP